MRTLLRVLIVEDSVDDAALILLELRRGGYEVDFERVETPENMAAALERAQWDVVLSDYSMPRFTALHALEVLKNQRVDIPFIIISGTIGEETAVSAMKAGAQDYLAKGKLARLVPALERELRDAQIRRDRRQAEEALRQSEERFRQIAETIDEVFWITDPSISEMLYVSPAYERVWGRPIASLYGRPKSFLQSVHVDDRKRVLAVLNAATPGQAFDHEYRIVVPNGAVRWISDRGFPVRDEAGQVVRFVGVAVEITGRKQAEAEKALLVTAIEQSAEAMVIANPIGDIEYVNPAFTRLSGCGSAEVLGKNLRSLKSADRAPEFFKQLWEAIIERKSWHGEISDRREDGKLHTEELTIMPVQGAGGEIAHFVSTQQDVTERRLLEQQFRQSQKMEAVGRLAGGVAHDFNNLLTVILGYSAMTLASVDAGDPAQGFVEEIKKAGDRAATLTRQLLAFSRQQVLDLQVLNVNVLAADVKNMLQCLIGADIELAMIRDPELGLVKADPGQLEQILVNLVVNSRDAMPQGGKLTIETANVTLKDAQADSQTTAPPGRYVMLAVSDTGTGMDAETLTHIFEPFFTTKEKGKGTGLGLSMVYGTVKQSGGYVWVDSELGRGSKFKIYLPRVEEADNSAPTFEAPEDSEAGTETILLVEDEEAVRSLAKRILEASGYKVLETLSAEDALQVGKGYKEQIDLLLTDVVMPRISGRKVAEHLGLLRPRLKVLYMSGFTDESAVRSGVSEADEAFLEKPFTPTSLARKVREVLDMMG